MRIWAQGIMVGLILLAGCQSPSTPATTTTGSGAYTVTFDSQGGSTVASISATSGAVIAAPTAPTKTGVTFGGWYKEAACTTAWVFASDVVTANLTLYAKWTSGYTVTFDSQGGSTVASISATSGAVIVAPTAPTKTGATFGGWYKEAACTTAWTFASDVVTANLTLYAKWTYTVTFDSQGGSTVTSISATSGAVIVAPTAPTKTGATFGGWYKEAACTTAWTFASDVVTANLTLYAKWTLVGATVSTLAGGTAGLLDGIGTAARFNYPTDSTIDSSGNVYVIDNKYLIRKVATDGTTTVFAGKVVVAFGTNVAVAGSVDGTGTEARFYQLGSITIDASGNLFVVDRDDYTTGSTSRVRKITSAGVVTTVTLTGLAAGTSLGDLSADGLGNLYATAYLFSATTMTGTYSIVRIGADGTVTTVATTSGTSSGLGVDKSTNTVLYLSGNNLYRLSAAGTSTLYTTFTGASYTPYGRIAVNASGEAFIHAGEALYKVSAGTITLYSGGTYSGGRDGPVASASYFNPHLGSFGPSGQLCLVESGGNRVRMITP